MRQLFCRLMPLVCLMPLLGVADEAGVRFEDGLSWAQVREKAKKENKWIFVDCYTTWCQPCKAMDKYTFTDPEVAAFINERYISARFQMDKAPFDSAEVRERYADAGAISRKYAVTAYPTLMFFSPEGKLLHRASAMYPPGPFMQLAKDAMDPSKQYYVQLQTYDPGKASLDELRKRALELRYHVPELVGKIVDNYVSRLPADERQSRQTLEFLMEFSGLEASREVVGKFIDGLDVADVAEPFNRRIVSIFNTLPQAQEKADAYFRTLSEADLLQGQALDFMASMTRNSRSVGFKYFYSHAESVNKLREPGFAEYTVSQVIDAEIVKPATKKAKAEGAQPDWNALHAEITRRYGEWYANYCLSDSKFWWYSGQGNRAEAFKHLVQHLNVYGLNQQNAFNLNEIAWNTFVASSDPAELKEALSWSRRALDQAPYEGNYIDTYSNLLYKLGNVKDAVSWQQLALKLSPEDPSIKANLEKMKGGVPTWQTRQL